MAAAVTAARRVQKKKIDRRGPALSSRREMSLRSTWSSPTFKSAMEKSKIGRNQGVPGPEQAKLRVAKCVKAAQAGDRDASSALNLQMLGLDTLPEGIFELADSLEVLQLSGNRLTALPMELGNLVSLVSLDLEAIELGTLSSGGESFIDSLTLLENLNLRNNELRDVPQALWKLKQLKSLDLGGNHLSALPAEISNLTALEDLRVDHNQLTGAVPASLYALSQLSTLHLQDNNLTTMPPGIAALSALSNLELAGNQLSELPKEMASMHDLIHIDVESNPMVVPPPEICEQSALAIRGFLEDLEDGSEAGSELDVFFLGSGATVHSSLAQVVEAETAEADTGKVTDVDEPSGAESGRSTAHRSGVMGGIDGVRAHTWCFPPRETVGGSAQEDDFLPATHQLLYHARCLYVIAVDLSHYSAQTHEQSVSRIVGELRNRVPRAVVLFVCMRGKGKTGELSGVESTLCSQLTSRVQQAEEGRQATLRAHLTEMREIIDTRENARKANPGQQLRARGWRAMKTLVGTAAKRNEELCNRIARQLEATPTFLRDGEPLCVDLSSFDGRQELKATLRDALSEHFPHIGAPLPSKYVALQRLIESQQLSSAKDVPPTLLGERLADGSPPPLAIYWNDFKVLAGRVGITRPDPVRRAARYLTLTGAVIHVSNDAALSPFVFVDPPRLAQTFSAIIHDHRLEDAIALKRDEEEGQDGGGEDTQLEDGLTKLRKKGALTVAVRRQICAGLKLDDHIGQVVFQMMSRVGLVVDRPSETEGTDKVGLGVMAALSAMHAVHDVMVPALLPDYPPGSMKDLWGSNWAGSWPSQTVKHKLNYQMRRVYTLRSDLNTGVDTDSSASAVSLSGLLSIVLSRLTQRVAAEPVEMWQAGACMAVRHELGVPGARILAEHSSNGGNVNGGAAAILSITLRTSVDMLMGGSVASLWGRLDDCVRAALEFQPGCVLGAYIACPFSQAKDLAPYLFTTTEVTEAWRDGALSLLSPGLGHVPLELLQPPTGDEAVDADKLHRREARVQRVHGLILSFMTERPKTEAKKELEHTISMQSSARGGPGFRKSVDTQLTPSEMAGLTGEQKKTRDRFSARMGFYFKDAMELVQAGDSKVLGEFEGLIPKILRRTHVSPAMLADRAQSPSLNLNAATQMVSGLGGALSQQLSAADEDQIAPPLSDEEAEEDGLLPEPELQQAEDKWVPMSESEQEVGETFEAARKLLRWDKGIIIGEGPDGMTYHDGLAPENATHRLRTMREVSRWRAREGMETFIFERAGRKGQSRSDAGLTFTLNKDAGDNDVEYNPFGDPKGEAIVDSPGDDSIRPASVPDGESGGDPVWVFTPPEPQDKEDSVEDEDVSAKKSKACAIM